jgi:hypothetical protein
MVSIDIHKFDCDFVMVRGTRQDVLILETCDAMRII